MNDNRVIVHSWMYAWISRHCPELLDMYVNDDDMPDDRKLPRRRQDLPYRRHNETDEQYDERLYLHA